MIRLIDRKCYVVIIVLEIIPHHYMVGYDVAG